MDLNSGGAIELLAADEQQPVRGADGSAPTCAS